MGLRQCPCKFRLGVAGKTNANVVVTDPQGNETTFTGKANFSAVQCFTGGPHCNPHVNNFKITFNEKGNTINLTQGRRGTISCLDHTIAALVHGTANGRGNAIPKQKYFVDFTYSINGNQATVEIMAVGTDGTKIQMTITARVSPQTFIGNCNETVGPH